MASLMSRGTILPMTLVSPVTTVAEPDDNNDVTEPVQKTGYCTHGSVLFPTWHRPYVVQYEVRIIIWKGVVNTDNRS